MTPHFGLKSVLLNPSLSALVYSAVHKVFAAFALVRGKEYFYVSTTYYLH